VQASDLLAAIGSVEGALSSSPDLQSVPAPVGPVSVIALHGDQDSVIHYCGDSTDASQENTFNYWSGSSANRCSTLDTTSPLCDAQGKITAVVEKDATSCQGSTEVKFYKLIGGDHEWYGDPMNVSGSLPFNPDFDSSTGVVTKNILWNFFAAHTRP
jgi:poly(3-hydroxybutyrate) depolymerase